jgi:flagellar hook-length control protein FliK
MISVLASSPGLTEKVFPMKAQVTNGEAQAFHILLPTTPSVLDAGNLRGQSTGQPEADPMAPPLIQLELLVGLSSRPLTEGEVALDAVQQAAAFSPSLRAALSMTSARAGPEFELGGTGSTAPKGPALEADDADKRSVTSLAEPLLTPTMTCFEHKPNIPSGLAIANDGEVGPAKRQMVFQPVQHHQTEAVALPMPVGITAIDPQIIANAATAAFAPLGGGLSTLTKPHVELDVSTAVRALERGTHVATISSAREIYSARTLALLTSGGPELPESTGALPLIDLVQAPALSIAAPDFATRAVPSSMETVTFSQRVSADRTEHSLDLAREDIWLDQLAKDILSAGTRLDRLTFRLARDNLGRLEVGLQHTEAGVSVQLTTAQESARQILATSQLRLTDELRSHGIRVADVQISSGSFGQNHDHHGQTEDSSARAQFIEFERRESNSEQAKPQIHSTGRYA